jgi:CBS domain-containing protein
MTTKVVLVDESTGFKEIIRRMEDSDVSALPVVDADGYPPPSPRGEAAPDRTGQG